MSSAMSIPRTLSRAALALLASRLRRVTKGEDRPEERARTADAFARPKGADRARAQALLEGAAAMSEEEVAEATRLIERDFVAKLVRLLGRLAPEVVVNLLSGYFALTDPRTPFAAKAGLAAMILYFVNPFDVMPDAVPLVGLLDDVGLLAAAWGYLRGNVREEHRQQAEAFLARA